MLFVIARLELFLFRNGISARLINIVIIIIILAVTLQTNLRRFCRLRCEPEWRSGGARLLGAGAGHLLHAAGRGRRGGGAARDAGPAAPQRPPRPPPPPHQAGAHGDQIRSRGN